MNKEAIFGILHNHGFLTQTIWPDHKVILVYSTSNTKIYIDKNFLFRIRLDAVLTITDESCEHSLELAVRRVGE